jgi:DNA polymerase III delta prime subunit
MIEKKVDESWKKLAKKEKPEDKKEKKVEDKKEEAADGPKDDKTQTAEDMPLPEMDFKLFVYSLTMQTMMHLGDLPNPISKETEMDLKQAKQTIDILGILAEKTKGNLDEDEKKMLENGLFDLRMRYVDKNKKEGS